jgi:hypothetical protein
MRIGLAVLVPALFTVLAGAQAIEGGRTAAPGAYAAPWVPQIATPSIAFATTPMQVGASSTPVSSLLGTSPFAEPMWYGQPAAEPGAATEEVNSQPAATPAGGFEYGVALFQSSVGAARLIDLDALRRHAARVYTNQDVAEASRNSGLVRFRGITKRLN